ESAVELLSRLPVLADRAKDTLTDVRKTLGTLDRFANELTAEGGSFNGALRELRAAAARVDKALDDAQLGRTTSAFRDTASSLGDAGRRGRRPAGRRRRSDPLARSARRALPARAHRLARFGGRVRKLRAAPVARSARALRRSRARRPAAGHARAAAHGRSRRHRATRRRPRLRRRPFAAARGRRRACG